LPTSRRDPLGQPWHPPAVADVRARLARLRNLYARRPDGIHVPEADLRLVLPSDGEVLGERSMWEVRQVKLRPPHRVVAGGVREHGLVLTAVHPQVGLAVAG